MEFCNRQFYGNNYKRVEVNSTENNAYAIDLSVDLNNITLFPQAVNNELTLEITTVFEGDVSFVISDVSGKQSDNWCLFYSPTIWRSA